VELFKQHYLDGFPGNELDSFFYDVLHMKEIISFESGLEFIGDINEFKDCLMSQDNTQNDPKVLWFNIDVPKGHGLAPGDRVRITVEKI